MIGAMIECRQMYVEFWKGSSWVAMFAGLGSDGSGIDDANDIARIWLGIGGLGDVDFGG